MPVVDINDLASIGAVRDTPPYMLPPEAWTIANNMRYRDRAPEQLLGWEAALDTPGVAPHFHMPISTVSQNFWLYVSLTKAYVYDGSTHADITRAVGGDYTAANTRDWNGTILGGIPLFNNGADVPQFRADMQPATKFANLTNWPSTLRSKIVRAFKGHLIAFNVTDNSVVLPHQIQWSHPADPGSLPTSWDYTDPTVDAGRKDLEDVNSGIIVDALPFADTMYIGKENSLWRMNYIGGRFIWDFKTLFETSGVLAPRCMANTADGSRQVIVTQEDMIWHQGGQPTSILDRKQRARLFGEMDTANYVNSFLFANPLYNEMWLCYPSQGNTHPNKALIWNQKDNTISEADGITFRNAAIGNIEGGSDELWSEGTDEWDEDTGPWSELTRRRVILAGTDATKFYNMDRGGTRDGTAFTSTLQREGLSVIGRKRNGEWIVDHQVIKMFQRLWPKVQGGPINIRFGVQETVDGPISWGTAKQFDPSTSRVHDPDEILSGAALAIEFSNDTGASWRIDGYKLEMAILGQF